MTEHEGMAGHEGMPEHEGMAGHEGLGRDSDRGEPARGGNHPGRMMPHGSRAATVPLMSLLAVAGAR